MCKHSTYATLTPELRTSASTVAVMHVTTIDCHYTHADFAKASRMISETDWDKLLSEDIDLYCARWQQTFLSIMEQLHAYLRKFFHLEGVISHG